MLQQTRVSAVIPYYERFLKRFPDVAALAAAPEQDLLAAWSGLGYYSRARNLQKAARQIVEQGDFPSDYERIRALSGVGDYTAAAIASIAFELPHVVVDGNVLRVMSRLGNDPAEITATATRTRLRERAQALLDRRHPGDFNQALMELGATVCLPKKPQCLLCPVQKHCAALAAGTQESLPVKGKRTEIHRVERTVLLFERNGRLLLRQRPPDAAKLAGFWELPQASEVPAATNVIAAGSFRHSITNHVYEFQVRTATVARAPRGFRWIERSRLEDLPLSTVARKALACVPSEAKKSKNSKK
jgi:A/G-specific adenine glycosylase